MDFDYVLPGIGVPNPRAGSSSETPIDLTEGEEPTRLLGTLPLPLAQRPHVVPTSEALTIPQKNTRKILKHSRLGKDEVKELTSHRQLQVFKERYFNELHIQKELTIASRAASNFDKTQLKTIIPSQYLHSALTGRNAALAGKKKGKGIRSGRSTLFPGEVEVLSALAAVKQAYEEHTPAKIDLSRLVLWTDASGASRGLGFAVVYREAASSKQWAAWKAYGFTSHGRLAGAQQLESIAVIKACEIAIRQANLSPGRYKSVAIYTDSKTFLDVIKQYQHQRVKHSNHALIDKITRKAMVVKKEHKIKISLHWVPGHSKVPGNELADMVAKIAARHRLVAGSTETIELSDGEGEDRESDREDNVDIEL